MQKLVQTISDALKVLNPNGRPLVRAPNQDESQQRMKKGAQHDHAL